MYFLTLAESDFEYQATEAQTLTVTINSTSQRMLSLLETDTYSNSPSLRGTHQIPNIVKSAENLHLSQTFKSMSRLVG